MSDYNCFFKTFHKYEIVDKPAVDPKEKIQELLIGMRVPKDYKRDVRLFNLIREVGKL